MSANAKTMAELRKWWDGAHVDQDHLSSRNIINAILLTVSLIPTLLITKYVYDRADGVQYKYDKLDNFQHLKTIWGNT